MKNEPLELSICIITYKRPNGLLRLLKSIEMQQISESQVKLEIVIVDTDIAKAPNSPTKDLIKHSKFPIQYNTASARRDISEGRNKAASIAQHSHILWLDDDQSLTPTFLLEARSRWRRYSNQAAGIKFGVKYVAENGTTRHDPLFQPWMQLPTEGNHLPATGVATNALLVKKDIFKDLKFDSYWGYIGGGDNAFFAQAHALGKKIISGSSLACIEWVPDERLKLSYFLRCHYRQGLTYAKLLTRHRNVGFHMRYAAQSSIFLALALAISCIAWIGGKNRFLLALFKTSRQLGKLAALVGIQYSIYLKNSK